MMNEATSDCVEAAKLRAKKENISFEAAYIREYEAREGKQQVAGGIDFMGEVEKIMTQKKVSRGAAVRIVANEQPKLHSEWLQAIQKGE
jgi:hypothetical protein